MTTFTKEQLIEQAKGFRMLAQCAVDARPDDVAAAKNLALAEIALAALNAPDDVPRQVLDGICDMSDGGVDAQGIWELCKAEITGENEPQPCPRCGVTSTRPNGEHYCHANGGKAD